MIKSKSGNIEFDSKFHKEWVEYYPDNDFYTNDELDAFLKRRVQALVEILDIGSEDDNWIIILVIESSKSDFLNLFSILKNTI